MMDLIELLEEKERKTVSLLAAVFGSLFIVFLVFGIRARLDAGRMAARRAGFEADLAASERARDTAEAESSLWTKAEADIEELRRSWFYDRSQGIRLFRKDLDEVLKKAGVSSEDMSFTETEVVKDRLRRIQVGFTWQGTYPAFRHLLETIEAHPRALQVAKIVFDNAGAGPGFVQAAVTLEGFLLHE